MLDLLELWLSKILNKVINKIPVDIFIDGDFLCVRIRLDFIFIYTL